MIGLWVSVWVLVAAVEVGRIFNRAWKNESCAVWDSRYLPLAGLGSGFVVAGLVGLMSSDATALRVSGAAIVVLGVVEFFHAGVAFGISRVHNNRP